MTFPDNIKGVLGLTSENRSAVEDKPTYEELEERITQLESFVRVGQAGCVNNNSAVLYQHIFENVFDSIFIINAHTGYIIDCNKIAANRLGYTKEELLALRVFDINIPKVHKHIKNRLENQLNGENSVFKTIHQHKKGHQMLAEESSTVLSINDRKLLLVSTRYLSDTQKGEQIPQRETTKKGQTPGSGRIMPDLLKICSSCKRIEKEEKQWQHVETYLLENAGVRFSHGICLSCAESIYPEFFQRNQIRF